MKSAIRWIVVLFAFAKANSQDITGKWQTTDIKATAPVHQITIYEQNGKYYGKVIAISGNQNPICENCGGAKKNQPITGMVILEGIEKNGNNYKGGTLLDTKTGKRADCKMWLNTDNPNLLLLRKYFQTITQTQTWQRL